MELDLLGLGVPPATAAAVGHGGPAMQRPDFEKTAFDEPPRLVPASTESPSPVPACVRRRPAVGTNDDVPAPPASKLKPSSMSPSPKVCVPAGAAEDKSPRASQLGSFRGIFPSTPILEGSAAASSSNPRHCTAPLTIFYSGSVRAFDSVPMEQAEKILFMTAKEAQAAEIPAFQQPVPQSEPAAGPSSSAAQMMMLLGLAKANVKDNLLPKRTASLARFLHKRKKSKVESATTMLYRRGEEVPTQMEQPWASDDVPKNMKENHGEAVNTELKI